jgi:hypothetical protein
MCARLWMLDFPTNGSEGTGPLRGPPDLTPLDYCGAMWRTL